MSTACPWRPLCQARTTLKGGQDFSQHETSGVHWKLEHVSQASLWQETQDSRLMITYFLGLRSGAERETGKGAGRRKETHD